jgi:hypothetical protein
MRYLLLLLLLSACEYSSDKTYYGRAGDAASWRRLDFGPFSVNAPGDWIQYSRQGIDSYVGGMSNGKDSLEFDYGPYSADVSPNDGMGKFAKVTIDGFPAVIRIPYKGGEGTYMIYLDRNDGNRLSFNGDISDINTALKIYGSLKFRNSHHGKTDSLYPGLFSDDFPITAKTGQWIFHENCAQCHSVHMTSTGPALTPGFLRERSDDWIYRFLTHRSSLKRDKLWLANWREYNKLDCEQFPALTRKEFDALMEWLRRGVQSIDY